MATTLAVATIATFSRRTTGVAAGGWLRSSGAVHEWIAATPTALTAIAV